VLLGANVSEHFPVAVLLKETVTTQLSAAAWLLSATAKANAAERTVCRRLGLLLAFSHVNIGFSVRLQWPRANDKFNVWATLRSQTQMDKPPPLQTARFVVVLPALTRLCN
jgi:hypothetical protein